jgi:hypothetical protein
MADRLFASTRKGLFEFRRKKDVWSLAHVSFLGSPVTGLLCHPADGALYAALDLGHFGVKLHESKDGGASWSEIAAPSYAGVDAGKNDPPSMKLLWTLEAGGADQPGRLWAGTIPGGLFRSEDRGRSWQLVRGLWDDPRRQKWMGGGYDHPGIHSVSVDPRDSRRIAVAVSTGGVWESLDDGESWSLGGKGLRAAYVPPEQAHDPEMQDVHRLARCPAAPDRYWIQHHNGIFKSVNGIAEWTEIFPPHEGGFGFAVAVDPARPERAWFVPAVKDEFRYPKDGKLLVAMTDDGGNSFSYFGNGLPQENAYDLIYRHGLVVDEEGRGLAMGSTTGGLWFSGDGGESWACAPARLPPVYALAYA